ncbi:hypothetical protein BD414DRAFT_456951 [Trametes punicea]|nr:hypothetical protein BD414DRAFT_456951 [Trametes punicea]
MPGSIIVHNAAPVPISVFVSKYTNSKGSDIWFTVPADTRESWERDGWELVAFKNTDDTHRAGVYVRVDSTVTFYTFKDITVS